MLSKRTQKLIIIPIVILILVGPILAPFAEGFNFPERYDLVAILVEQGIYSDTGDYDGLVGAASGPITRTTLKGRIDRYAIDVQTALPGTRAVIIQADRFEKPENIAAVLEKLYFEGDPREPNRIAYLKGVVIVGEVPLPVVDKQGSRFISVFPYTDFEQKAYVWNPSTKDWQAASGNPNPQPEIWHGVIRPPVSTQLLDGKRLLAAYFDKNHLYHVGDPNYATFNKRVFFQDFVEEEKSINPVAYQNYLKFIEHQSDISYFRYTRELYQDLSQSVNEELDQIRTEGAAAAAALSTQTINGQPIPMDSTVPQPALPPGTPQPAGSTSAAVNQLPDIMTKIGHMSDNLMFRYYQAFTNYPNLINDFIRYTGRYVTRAGTSTSIDVDSAINLVTSKDNYTMAYLKAVNTMVENKIDEIVERMVQKPIPLVTETTFRVTDIFHKPLPGSTTLFHVPPNELSTIGTTSPFTNFSSEFKYRDCPRVSGVSSLCVPGLPNVDYYTSRPPSVYGRPFSQITNVAQCSLFRGSTGSSTGRYSKLVEANHAFNPKSATEADNSLDDLDAPADRARCQDLMDNDIGWRNDVNEKNCPGFTLRAGCFNIPAGVDPPYNYDNPNQRLCFPEHAISPVFDAAGTREISSAPTGYDDYRTCFNFHEKNTWQEHINGIVNYFKEIDNDDWNMQQRLNYSRDPRLTNVTRNSQDIILFQKNEPNDTYQLRLSDILNGIGFSTTAGNLQDRLNLLLAYENGTTVNLGATHNAIQSVTVAIDRQTAQTPAISSVFYHKEPTTETLNAQARNMMSLDLPVDQPRYLTFQTWDLANPVGRITYPDIYVESSFDSYMDKLRDIENRLNTFRRNPPTSPLPCVNCLTSLVASLPEIAINAGGSTTVSRANREKVLDSLNWKNMDIDAKHKYLSEYYLDSTKNAYIGESVNGYELAYFNGSGLASGYNFSLAPQQEETDSAFTSAAGNSTPEPPLPPDDFSDNQFYEPPETPSADRSYDLFSWSPPPISPWWERMQEWAREMSNRLTPARDNPDNARQQMEEENRRELEQIQRANREIENNPADADQVALGRITAIGLETDSTVVAGGRRNELRIVLRDNQGNIVNDEFARVTLVLEETGGTSSVSTAGTSSVGTSVESSAHFSADVIDENAALPGHQITMTSGSQIVGLIGPQYASRVKVTAQIEGASTRGELNLNIVSDARIVLQAQTIGVVANGTNELAINAVAQDSSGQIITGVNGPVSLAVSDTLMGRIREQNIRFVNGRAFFHFIAGTKSGALVINATSSALNSGRLELNMLPGRPVRVGLTSDSQYMPSIPGSRVQMRATIFDANNNAVTTNSAAQIAFRITESTRSFGTLSSTSQQVSAGAATVNLLPTNLTGDVNIIAESPGLASGALTIRAVGQFGEQEISRMRPEALAVSLLGIPAGNVAERNYLAGLFMMNQGKTQVSNSLTAQPVQYTRLIDINSNGGLTIPNTARISADFLPANNFTMTLRDNILQNDIAKMTIFTLREGQFDVTQAENPDQLADGIYMRKITTDESYQVDRRKGALRVSKDEMDKVEIQTNGYLAILDNSFSVRPADGRFLTLQVLDGDTPVAEIYFVQHFNQDVNIQETISQAPGVYVAPFRTPPNIFYERSWAGNSSSDPRGVAFYDRNMPVSGASAPGFSFKSLEDSSNVFGIGFTQDNKFALLFSSGEIFGEANRPYASDIGIVLGDPTVKVTNSGSGDFTTDIGKLLYAGAADIRGLLNLDYNSDGFEDILILEGEGKIRLIQNNGGYDQLKDQGYIMDVKNGIADFTKADYNNDGQMDLIVAGRVSCRRGDTCVDVYENQEGAFVRHNLHFNETETIVTVKAEDLNNDRFPELVLANASGEIKILYNRAGQFDQTTQTVGNVGLQVNPGENLIANVLVRYAGMPERNPSDQQSGQRYHTLSVVEPNPGVSGALSNMLQSGLGQSTVASPQRSVERDFIYADLDAFFASSAKTAQDVNGGIVRSGDIIRYTITLQNSGAAKTNMLISDIVAEQLELNRGSIACSDCGANRMTTEELNGDPIRPLLFKINQIPAGASRHITYETLFRGDADTSDKINIIFSNRFSDTNASLQSALRRDQFIDMSVTKEGNTTGRLRYFYTTGIGANGNLQWGTSLSSPPQPTTADQLQVQTGLRFPVAADFNNFPVHCNIPALPPICILQGGKPTGLNSCDFRITTQECQQRGGEVGDPAGPPPIVQTQFQEMQDNDSDGDGLQDTIDDINGGLEAVANATQNAISRLTCNAGCIPLPVNAAFLSPGFFSILGTPGPFDIGLPVFGWGAPSIIPTYPPMPPLSTLGGRFYISPSLTGGVGFAVCLGPFGTPMNCFSFGVNPLDLIAPGVCDQIAGAMNDALSAVNDAIGTVNEGMTVSLGGGGSPPAGAGGRGQTGSGMSNVSLGSYSAPISRSRNIRIPGIFTIISDWAARQWEEVMKIVSIPDIYLIYPDPSSVFGSVVPTQRFSRTGNVLNNVLSYVNSIPLVDVETEEVTFKIPIISRQEIERFKADAKQWIDDERQELIKVISLLDCLRAPLDRERCRILTVDFEGFINSVAANMRALDEWMMFPKRIAQYRAIEAYYMRQIINYVDTIIEWTGGWVARNISRVRGWRRAIRQIRDILRSWRLIFQLMIDYNVTCDRCKTERYSLKDLILKVFIAIPQPPVIPLPKLPDIIIDVSKVQAGLKIKWPDIKFKPEPLKLPKIPRLPLGLNIPLFKLRVPDFPVIPSPPSLPDLPPLPPLPLPKLPDFPPAPTMPGLPGPITMILSLLRQILKILCLIRLGFLPTNELLLKTRIEEITARGLAPLLPIDLLFTIESPTISATYVDQLVITAFTKLQLDFSAVQTLVETAARLSNGKVADMMKWVNKAMSEYSKTAEEWIKKQQDKIIPEALQQSGRTLNYLDENYLRNLNQKELENVLSKELGIDVKPLVNFGMQLRAAFNDLEGSRKENEKIIASLPKTLTIEMQTEEFGTGSRQQATGSRQQAANIVLPLQKRLKEYRDRLAAYVDETENMFANPSVAENFAEFSRYLVSQKGAFVDKSLKRYIAESDVGRSDASFKEYSREPVKAGPLDVETLDWLPNELEEPSKEAKYADSLEKELKDDMEESPDLKEWLAFYTVPDPPQQLPAGMGQDASGLPRPQNTGLFYIAANGQSQRLINYVHEADRVSKLADIDLDRDGDRDKIYSYGNNVYLKRNNRNSGRDARPVFRPADVEIWTIYELLPKGMSPDFPRLLEENTHEASFSFSGSAMDNVAGYEIIAKNSPLFFERAVNSGSTIRAHLLPETSAPALSSPQGTTTSAQDQEFAMPEFQAVYATVKNVSGAASFIGRKREYMRSSNGRIRLAAGEIIHPLENARLKWDASAPAQREFNLSKNIMVQVPESATDGMDMEVESGFVEVIRLEQNTQPVAAGMALLFEDKINVRSGSIVVNYERGGDTSIRANEKYILGKLESLESPMAALQLDPAFYFAKIYAFDAEGNRSTPSEKLLLAPQVCSDGSPPVANVGESERRIAVGRILALDATRSFDAEGRVISYWLDTDTSADSDGNGAADDDKDLKTDLDPASDSDQDGNRTNDGDSPYFTLGPYSEVGQKRMRLVVRDEALNQGYQDITLNIIVPRIVLEGPPLANNIITGYVDPPEENAPITIARLRPGTGSAGWEMLRTPSAGPGGQYYTNVSGHFEITDMDLKDRLVVRNNENIIVAEINTQTGQVTVSDNRYETRLIPSSVNLPMRIGVFLRSDQSMNNPLTFVYFTPDVNTDVTIDGQEINYDSQTVLTMSGVHVKPLVKAQELGFSFRVLPASDNQIPGAAVVERQRSRAAVIDVTGDVLPSDQNIIVLVKNIGASANAGTSSLNNLTNEPVVFEMTYNREVIAEIFIAAHLGQPGRVQIVDQPRLPARPQPGNQQSQQPFSDILNSDPFASILRNLFRLGIVAGYRAANGQLEFRPQNPINRAEFTQITLKMLCIVPRDEAHRLPSPFYDVLDERLWFYPVLKEGNIREFIRGYIGESRIDGQTGRSRTPFKPAANITWAEAATVVLAALQEEDIIDLSRVNLAADQGMPWYQKYVAVAQNLRPYIKNPTGAEGGFLITADEAVRANQPISRQDFAIMADRVLLMRNCYGPGRLNPNEDADRDGVLNGREQELGTDPFRADTDNGGISDYDEIQRGTNPLNNPYDDRPQAPAAALRNTNEEGIFVLRPACYQCPCRAAIGSGADLQTDDILFAAITGTGGLPIYAKSNEESL